MGRRRGHDGRRGGDTVSRRARERAVAALAGVVAALAVLEIGLRATGVAPPLPKLFHDGVFIPDPVLPYRLKPAVGMTITARTGEFRETIRHNRDGFRDVDHETAKPPGTFRILGVGDSFTYGAGAEFKDTYLRVLERSLALALPTTRVEIVKAGIGGFCTESERLLVERAGLAYQPDLVLLGFNATDLFETSLGLDRVRVREGPLRTVEARRLGRTVTWLVMHSHAARWLHRALSGDDAADLHRRFEASPEAREAAWKRIAVELARLRDSASAAGARVVVAFLPLGHAKDGPDLERLRAECAALDLPVIDTTPALRAAAAEGPVYWPKDGHCTPRGYHAIARALHEGLLRIPGALAP